MNKKGFTLIELLAVITILVILSLVIIPIVDSNIRRSKQDMYNIQIENIRMAAVNYFTNNMSMRPSRGNYCYISLDFLENEDYMSEDVINPNENSFYVCLLCKNLCYKNARNLIKTSTDSEGISSKNFVCQCNNQNHANIRVLFRKFKSISKKNNFNKKYDFEGFTFTQLVNNLLIIFFILLKIK